MGFAKFVTDKLSNIRTKRYLATSLDAGVIKCLTRDH